MLTRPTQAHKLTLHGTIGTFPHHFSLLPQETALALQNKLLPYTRSSFFLLSPFSSIWGQNSMSGLSELPSKRLATLNQAADLLLKSIRIICFCWLCLISNSRVCLSSSLGSSVSYGLLHSHYWLAGKCHPGAACFISYYFKSHTKSTRSSSHSHWVPVTRTRNVFTL